VAAYKNGLDVLSCRRLTVLHDASCRIARENAS